MVEVIQQVLRSPEIISSQICSSLFAPRSLLHSDSHFSLLEVINNVPYHFCSC